MNRIAQITSHTLAKPHLVGHPAAPRAPIWRLQLRIRHRIHKLGIHAHRHVRARLALPSIRHVPLEIIPSHTGPPARRAHPNRLPVPHKRAIIRLHAFPARPIPTSIPAHRALRVWIHAACCAPFHHAPRVAPQRTCTQRRQGIQLPNLTCSPCRPRCPRPADALVPADCV